MFQWWAERFLTHSERRSPGAEWGVEFEILPHAVEDLAGIIDGDELASGTPVAAILRPARTPKGSCSVRYTNRDRQTADRRAAR